MDIKKYTEAEWKDVHNGIRYVQAHNKDVKMKDIPVLLVGLGGSGIKAMLSFKEKAESIYPKENSANLEYLAIDTDDIGKDANLSRKDTIIIQSADTAMLLREGAEDKEIIPKEIKYWLDPRMSPFKVMNGAAGIRQAGRLILFLNILEVYQALEKKISRIRVGYDLHKIRIQVYLFTGIGGGTGSGMFVDISYLIRKICPNADMNGIIIMPDVSCQKKGLRDITKRNIKRNGFAALKELEYLMMLRRYNEWFRQGYPGNIGEIYTQVPIFDNCILVGSQEEGRKAVSTEEEVYERIGEYVLTELQEKSIRSFGIESFKSNLASQNADKECFFEQYAAIGAKTEYIPVDQYYSLWLSDTINAFLQDIKVDIDSNEKPWVQRFKDDLKQWVEEVYDKAGKNLRVSDEAAGYQIKTLQTSLLEKFREVVKQNDEDTIIIKYCLQDGTWTEKFKKEIQRYCEGLYPKRYLGKKANELKKDLGQIYLESFCGAYGQDDPADCEGIKKLVELLEHIRNRCRAYWENTFDEEKLFSGKAFETRRESDAYQKSIAAAKRVIIRDYLEHPEKWNGQKAEDKIEWLSDYVARLLDPCFNESGCRSIFQLLEYHENGRQMMEIHLQEMFDRLDKTRQLWPTAATMVKTSNSYEILVVPSREGVDRLAERWAETANTNVSIVPSDIDQRFSKVLYVPGYSLYSYEGLPEFENEYNAQTNKYGVHLYASEDTNWEYLPSPYFETKWRAEDRSARSDEKKLNDIYREIFDRAAGYGIITYEEDKKMYCFRVECTRGDVLLDGEGPEGAITIYVGNIENVGEDPSYEKLVKDMFIHMFTYRDRVAEAVKRAEGTS